MKKLIILCAVIWSLVLLFTIVLCFEITYTEQIPKIEEVIVTTNIIEEKKSEEKNTKQLALDICEYYYSLEIADEIFKQCEEYKLPVYVIYALIDTESEMYNKAKSKKNCRGLCQVSEGCLIDYNKVHKQEYEFDDMYDVRKNIQVGIWYYQRHRKEVNDDWVQLYAIYNNGLAGYRKNGTANIQSAVDRFSSKLEEMKIYFN